MRKNLIYDRPTSLPVNRLAARILKPGINYEPDKIIDQRHWDARPKTIPVSRSIKNVTGKKFGRFTVVGLYLRDKRGSLWAVKCVCGSFETRRTRSVINPSNDKDRCDKCRHLAFLQEVVGAPACSSNED